MALAKDCGYDDIKKAISLFLGDIDGQITRADAKKLADKMRETAQVDAQEVPF